MPLCPSRAFLLWQGAAGGKWRRFLRQPVSADVLGALWALQVYTGKPGTGEAAPQNFVDSFMGS